jgi:phage/plasmid-like protein (TIGR03299 family)
MHNLEVFADGSAAMFSAREVPWHGLGVVTDGALTAEDALRTASLDWEVTKSDDPVTVAVPDADGVRLVACPGKYMTYRNHPVHGLQGLGVVGSKYRVIQNREAFEFLNYLSHESGAVFETAGSLAGGRQVFMSMRMPEHFTTARVQDLTDWYLMCTTTHDGTRPFTVAVTPVRAVCQNTVTLGLREAASTFTLRHTTNVRGKIAVAAEALELVYQYQETWADAVNALEAAPFSDAEFAAFLSELVQPQGQSTDLKEQRAQDLRDELAGLWKADTQANIAGTKWAAYNTVVEWADWYKPVRAEAQDVSRAERIVSGGVQGVKDRAYALLTA